METFPPLAADTNCDVVILGAGITGALVAEALTEDGHDVVVLDECDVGHGSTSASTALLQYEVDTHLIDLIRMHGQSQAEKAYLACHESIDLLEQKIASLGIDCAFTRKESVYLASRKSHLKTFQKEGDARRAIGIHVENWGASEVGSKFGFDAHGALYSTQAAEVDAYRLTIGLLRASLSRGARIFDRTSALGIDIDAAGVMVRTNRNATIRAKRVIVAMGYQSQTLFRTAGFVKLNSSFAVASEPLADDGHWWHRCLLWESSRPYFYLRTDDQGRAIMGGEDVPFRNPMARDKLIPAKTRALKKRFDGLFPDASMEVAYSWAGTFGETEDGLAYIGAWKEHPLSLFALGFGGNGITYSVVAAEILRKEITGHRHPYSEVFRFTRT